MSPQVESSQSLKNEREGENVETINRFIQRKDLMSRSTGKMERKRKNAAKSKRDDSESSGSQPKSILRRKNSISTLGNHQHSRFKKVSFSSRKSVVSYVPNQCMNFKQNHGMLARWSPNQS